MDVVKKQYECVSGYAVAPEGTYEIGDEIDGIGAVQYIVDPDKPAAAMGRIKSPKKPHPAGRTEKGWKAARIYTKGNC